MKLIPLTQDYKAMIDDNDYEMINRYNWCVVRYRSYIYVSSRAGSRNTNTSLHRFIMKTPDGLMVDHIDGDGLNNQRSNLRIVTRGQNRLNSFDIAQSGYKGVFKTHNGKFGVRFGAFDTAEEAAKAYDKIIKENYGEYAKLNFPEK